MEIKDMQIEDIEARMSEINGLLNSDDADIDALTSEVDALIEQRTALETRAVNKKNLLEKVAVASVKPMDAVEERKVMSNEVTKAELFDAIAENIKGRATPEQRALLTTNATGGTVSVATILDDYIWTDWEKSPILSRVRKVYIRGNYKVNYEASATGAEVHEEGKAQPTEEQLVLGTVDFVAEYIKKWISVSDNVMALRGQAFMDYLHDEFGHQLAKTAEGLILSEIENSTLTAKVTHALDGDAVLAGLAKLSDEAVNPVVIMGKQTYANIKSIRTTAGSRIDEPFEGLEVLFNNMLDEDGGTILVGDLDGVVANFPEGEEFRYIVDETTMATQDMIRIIGKVMMSAHLVRPNGFARITAE